MRCKHCGYDNPKGAKYCCQCGSAKINEAPENELYELFTNPRTRDNLVKNLCKFNLSDDQYKVVELHFFKGLSYEQIAEELHRPFRSIKQILGNALSKLRRLSVIELECYCDLLTMRNRLSDQNEIDKQRILFLEKLLSENGICFEEENVPIGILHLPSRTETSLKDAGIYYLSQLTELTFQEVKKIKGIGYVGETEIWKALEAIGMSLNDKDDNCIEKFTNVFHPVMDMEIINDVVVDLDDDDDDDDEKIIYDENE